MTSPFYTHRSKVLGHYGTSAWLRGVVLALANGQAHKVGLSNVCGVDDAHFQAFIEMLTHYRVSGDNDLAFRQLVDEVQSRRRDEIAAAEREERFSVWSREAEEALRRLGKDENLIGDRYNWFFTRFDAGDTPAAAAMACLPLPALD